jgi:hypothetical protein
MVLEQAKQRAEQISGVSNVAYDLLTILQNKLQAISALEEYKIDAQQAGDQEVLNLLAQLEQREREDVDKLKGLTVQRLH